FQSVALSPDGERLAFTTAAPDGSGRLWVRRIDSTTAEPLTQCVAQGHPFWSPDSRSIAFFADEKLMKIDLRGGPPQTICDAPGGIAEGAWAGRTILFHPGFRGALYRVDASGGHAEPATVPDGSHQQSAHGSP